MRPSLFVLAVVALGVLVGCSQSTESDASTEESNQGASASITDTTDAAAAVVGLAAPALTVEESMNWTGALPNLEELKGNVVVLDFWAYW